MKQKTINSGIDILSVKVIDIDPIGIGLLASLLSSLSENERLVLKCLSSNEPISPVQLASKLKFLPYKIKEATEELENKGFVNQVTTQESNSNQLIGDKVVSLSQKGQEAQMLLPLMER